MGMDVTTVEPTESVVVRFPKAVDVVEVAVVEVLLLFPECEEALLVVRVPELEDWAAEGVAANPRAETRKRARNIFILVSNKI